MRTESLCKTKNIIKIVLADDYNTSIHELNELAEDLKRLKYKHPFIVGWDYTEEKQ